MSRLTSRDCLLQDGKWCPDNLCYFFPTPNEICPSTSCPWYMPSPCPADTNFCYADKDRCDGRRQCPHGQDEHGCNLREDYVAVNCKRELYGDVFKCNSGICISEIWRCDGTKDCLPNGEDEVGCESYKRCGSGNNYHCDDHTKCYDYKERCDLSYFCDDHTDEMNCTMSVHTGRFLVYALPPLVAITLLVCIIAGICCCVKRSGITTHTRSGFSENYTWQRPSVRANTNRRNSVDDPRATVISNTNTHNTSTNPSSMTSPTTGFISDGGEYRPPPRVFHEDEEYHPPTTAVVPEDEEPVQPSQNNQNGGQPSQAHPSPHATQPGQGLPHEGHSHEGRPHEGQGYSTEGQVHRHHNRRAERRATRADPPSYDAAVTFPTPRRDEAEVDEVLPSYDSVINNWTQCIQQFTPHVEPPSHDDVTLEEQVPLTHAFPTPPCASPPPQYLIATEQPGSSVSSATQPSAPPLPQYSTQQDTSVVMPSAPSASAVHDSSIPGSSVSVSSVPVSSVPGSSVSGSSVPCSSVSVSSVPDSSVHFSIHSISVQQDRRPTRGPPAVVWNEDEDETMV